MFALYQAVLRPTRPLSLSLAFLAMKTDRSMFDADKNQDENKTQKCVGKESGGGQAAQEG